jgi:hypothetical protein
MKSRYLAFAGVCLLTGCGGPTDAGDFNSDDFVGVWSVSVPETQCWSALDLVFVVEPAMIQRLSRASIRIDSRWHRASDPSTERLVTGHLDWSDFRSFSFAFFETSVAFAVFSGADEGFATDRLEGLFFDPNRQSCSHVVVAVKQ